jgi:hypothetical protein
MPLFTAAAVVSDAGGENLTVSRALSPLIALRIFETLSYIVSESIVT